MESTKTLGESRGMSDYVGRFAPSPTGPLHFGSLVAAVASYADARAARGTWLLRIEDVDTARCSQSAETEIRRQLAAYGFQHDGEVIRQSERSEHYEAALQELENTDVLFACTCTRRQLDSAARNAEGEIIYPGTCSHKQETGLTHALRVRVPDSTDSLISFTDRARGTITQNLFADVGDFVLRRADGLYAYQLAVVVDDSLQGVTHVVRGEDLLFNTPRQIFLQRLLGYQTPVYLHVPLARNRSGEKLSKQTRARALATDNVLPALHETWAFLGQTPVGPVQSIAAFWQRAIELWSVAPLVALSPASPGEHSDRVPAAATQIL